MRLSARRLSRPPADAGDLQRVVPVRPGAQVVARVGLWTLVALGAFGGIVGAVRPAAEPAARAAGSDGAGIPAEVAGYAELAVKTWLEASGDDDAAAVAALFAGSPSTAESDTGRRRVEDTYTVGARRLGDGYWAVTVAAGVDESGSDGHWHSVGTWYLEVGVYADDEGALVATGEPALVPAPAEPEDVPRPAGGSLGVPSSDDEDMATTVEGFLAALLAGDGDVSRYLAPGVDITPVTPPPFARVSLLRWSLTELSDGRARVRLAARATSPGGVPRTLGYELVLSERAGRWEVRSLSGAPAIARHAGDGGTGATTTTSTSEPSSTTTSVSIAPSPGA